MERQFKIVESKCMNFFKAYEALLPKPLEISEKEKREFGFYFLVLGAFHDLEPDEVAMYVTDNHFCKTLLGKGNEDLGVDAYYIDEVDQKIYIYNFKHKNKFESDSCIEGNTVSNSAKFVAEYQKVRTTRNFKNIDPITKKAIENILDKLDGNGLYEVVLRLVSNATNKGIYPNFAALRISNGLSDIQQITLEDIYSLFVQDNSSLCCTMLMDRNELVTYEEDKLSSRKMYIASIGLRDIIRICSNDQQIRGKTDIDDLVLMNADFELNILYENIRGFLEKSRINEGIMSTLAIEPKKFFAYNNGVTIIANNVASKPTNGGVKQLLTLDGIQIVNGGQTLRTLYKYVEQNRESWISHFDDAKVLVKIVSTENDQIIMRRIAQYTNSQNPISIYDLRSMDDIQVGLEIFLETKKITYIRKQGDFGQEKKAEFYLLSMQRLAQIIYSSIGYPHKAASNKKELFDSHYHEIFSDTPDLYDKVYEYINDYRLIVQELISIDSYTEQRAFYILYIIYTLGKENITIEEAISILQKALKFDSKDHPERTDNIRMLRNDFKNLIDKKCNAFRKNKKKADI